MGRHVVGVVEHDRLDGPAVVATLIVVTLPEYQLAFDDHCGERGEGAGEVGVETDADDLVFGVDAGTGEHLAAGIGRVVVGTGIRTGIGTGIRTGIGTGIRVGRGRVAATVAAVLIVTAGGGNERERQQQRKEKAQLLHGFSSSWLESRSLMGPRSVVVNE